MPQTLLRLGQYLLIAGMFAACGGHWLVLQSVAWSGMLVEYSRTANLTVAVEKTFDGLHPCGLCREIQSGKQNEQKNDIQVNVSKLEFFYAIVPGLIRPSGESVEGWLVNYLVPTRTEQPSVPPPRRV